MHGDPQTVFVVFLIVGDEEGRYAEASLISRIEVTVIIEKLSMEMLALQTPDARLFSFLVLIMNLDAFPNTGTLQTIMSAC